MRGGVSIAVAERTRGVAGVQGECGAEPLFEPLLVLRRATPCRDDEGGADSVRATGRGVACSDTHSTAARSDMMTYCSSPTPVRAKIEAKRSRRSACGTRAWASAKQIDGKS